MSFCGSLGKTTTSCGSLVPHSLEIHSENHLCDSGRKSLVPGREQREGGQAQGPGTLQGWEQCGLYPQSWRQGSDSLAGSTPVSTEATSPGQSRKDSAVLPGSCFLHPKGAPPRLRPEAGLQPLSWPLQARARGCPAQSPGPRVPVPGCPREPAASLSRRVALLTLGPGSGQRPRSRCRDEVPPLTDLPPSLFPPRSKANFTDCN